MRRLALWIRVAASQRDCLPFLATGGEAMCRPGMVVGEPTSAGAEVLLAQRRAFVVAACEAAALKLRHHQVHEIRRRPMILPSRTQGIAPEVSRPSSPGA